MHHGPRTLAGFGPVGGLVSLLLLFSPSNPAAETSPPLDRDNLLAFVAPEGPVQPVRTIEDWSRRRAGILDAMQQIMGPLPDDTKRCALDPVVVEETDCGEYVRRLIEYSAEPGSRTPAYLLIPKRAIEGGAPCPAVLCLHPTDNTIGFGVVVGLGGRTNRQYAAELARRGYVTLAPSYPQLAAYQPDLKALGYASGTMKAIWDNIRGLDLLASLPFVRPGGFGAIGHSLGGHNAVFTAVFDPRLKLVISSCGLDSFQDYYRGQPEVWQPGRGWTQERYMPRLAAFRDRLADLPFDFPELIGALAPRVCFLSAPLRDANFHWDSVDAIAAAARPVYDLFEAGPNLIVEHPDCDHDFPPDVRERAYRLLDATLRPPDEPSRFSARTAPLAERFARPPAANRILKIIHGWPDAAAAQDRLRERLLDQGFGGLVCNVAFDQYLESEPQWAAFVRAVTAARQAGMALWLYDERGYPSGNAGGLVLRDHPEWEAAGMLTVDKECGPGPVSLTVPPGDLVLAVAFPLPAGAGPVIPSAEPVSLPLPADGRIEWTAPAGRWRLLVVTRNRLYEGTHADGNLWQKMPYVNLLQAAPTERFIEVTHHRYARHFDGRLGDWFEATFTDEPSLMSMFFQRMPWRPLPWSAELPAEFRRRRGYDLAPLLPDLLLAEAGPDAARHRHDFWQTIGELVSENYFGQIETACRTLGLPSGGHLLAEENIVNHVPLYGDLFACLRRMGAPSIDCLTSLPPDVPWHIARLTASAAELEGRSLVMSETSDHAQVWRPEGDTRPKRPVTEPEIRGTCDRLLVAGVNVITSYYSFMGLPDDALRRLNEWVGRCSTFLQGGHQVADIAVVYPAQSLWTHFIPAAHWANASPHANRIGNIYRTVLDALFDARRDFTVIDDQTLRDADIRGDVLEHGPLRWRVVVLPGVDTLSLAAWEKLERFARAGGAVVVVGSRPANSVSAFPDDRVIALGRRLLDPVEKPHMRPVGSANGAVIWLPAGGEVLLPGLLDRRFAPDLEGAPTDAPLRVTHRRIDGREVYFVINDGPEPWEGRVRFAARGSGRLWDPAEGSVRELSDQTPAPLRLPGYGGVLATFDRAVDRPALPLPAGSLAADAGRPVEVGPFQLSHGEFVKAVVEVDGATAATRAETTYRAAATLTRSDVDTFLFVRLPVRHPETLRDASVLELETRVPPGQRTPAQLLVILHEKDGGDFLAETSRSLGVAGRETVFVPLNRFGLAGWSRDADGRLDASRIEEIRIGWGGYYGATGERVEFSTAVPRFIGTPPDAD